jgi:hypothetical protein
MRKREREMDHMDVSPFLKAIQNNALAHEEETQNQEEPNYQTSNISQQK